MIAPLVDRSAIGPGAVLADVRHHLDGRSEHESYRAGHLPGAAFVDLHRWLAGPPSPEAGRGPLPEPEVFAEGMMRAGISNGDVVVAYDDEGGVVAARLVWMLRALGEQAALLDGGLRGWDGPLQTDEGERPRGRFTARPWPAERLAGIDDAADARNVVLDARPGPRFRGETEPIDPVAGHIPGARSVPAREHLGADGFHRPAPELRARFEAAGVRGDTPVVAYCGSGVTACHELLALELAGFPPGRLYPGSWSQYSHRRDLPVARGA